MTIGSVTAARDTPDSESARTLEAPGIPDQPLLDEAAMRAVEAERARIARELHDSVGQLLTAARLALGTEGTSPGVVASLLADAMTEVARICSTLEDDRNLQFGLGRSLQRLARRTDAIPDVRCTLTGDVRNASRNHAALQLYRIAQEAVNNAVRHSGATSISLDLSSDGGLTLVVSDNGRWAAPDRERPGRGLMNMSARATSIGAHLEFQKADGSGGTTVCVYAPVAAAVHDIRIPDSR